LDGFIRRLFKLNFSDMLKKSFLSLCLLCVLGLLQSCTPSSSPSVNRAKLIATHASPNAPAINLVVDNEVIGGSAPTRLAYTQSVRVELDPGTRRLRVRLDNVNPPIDLIDIPSVTFSDGGNFSFFVIDTLRGTSNLKTLLLTDNLATPPAGQAGVRFLHLSPDAPAVDVVTFTGTPGLPQNVQVLTNGANRTFNTSVMAAQSAFVNIPANTQLGVRLAGTTGSLIGAFPMPGGGSTVAERRLYTLCVMGLARANAPQGQGLVLITIPNN
jgi:hypothetical protein